MSIDCELTSLKPSHLLLCRIMLSKPRLPECTMLVAPHEIVWSLHGENSKIPMSLTTPLYGEMHIGRYTLNKIDVGWISYIYTFSNSIYICLITKIVGFNSRLIALKGKTIRCQRQCKCYTAVPKRIMSMSM